MKSLAVVLASWLLAVAAITIGYITERGIHWPEFWILGASGCAAIAGGLLPPKHRTRWLLPSPLIAILAASLAWVVTFGWFSRANDRESEAWLLALFTNQENAAPGRVTCQRPLEEPAVCSFRQLAEARRGIIAIGCVDNFPLALRGWECRAPFGDGTSLGVDAWVGWSERWAHAYPRDG